MEEQPKSASLGLPEGAGLSGGVNAEEPQTQLFMDLQTQLQQIPQGLDAQTLLQVQDQIIKNFKAALQNQTLKEI